LKLIALAAFCAAAGWPVHAQTVVPAKAASSPAGKTLSLGAGHGGGPLLTREELRACLTRQAALRTRRSDLDAQRGELDKDKQAIGTDREALRAERAGIADIEQKITDLNARMTAYGERAASWSQRVKAFNAKPPEGDEGEKLRQELAAEQDELKKQQQTLEADKAELSSGDNQGRITTFKAHAKALEAKVEDWNQRNHGWNETAQSLDDERTAWLTSCADRRYREDDEIAIKKGK
jgi:chromosome segregation ATPase